jgi:meprin B
MRILFLLLLLGITTALPVEHESHINVDLDFEDNVVEEGGLFEGDIVLQPGENPLHRNAVADKRRTWANGVVPYEIQSSYPTTVKNLFQEAMRTIEDKTKVNGKACITFKPRSGESAYVRFENGNGCHTPVGYIGRKSSVTIGHGCERKGTIMHELLHALGFWHEQSRTDRDKYVTIHLENVQKGHEGNFNKYPVGYIDMLGQPYDYDSVMHYSAYAFAIDRSKPTIVPKQSGAQIGQRTHLCTIDIREIQLLYGCTTDPHVTNPPINSVTTKAPISTFTSAPVAGTDYCSFQSNLCHWTQSRSDNTNWKRRHGATPSSQTGPSQDHLGSTSNNYLYVEASGHSNQYARLDSKSFPGGDYCIDFYYHMYGSDMGTLTLNVKAGSQILKVHTWSGNHGDHWTHQRASVNIHTSGTFKFEFEGHVGKSYHSDMAIDDITIHPGHC